VGIRENRTRLKRPRLPGYSPGGAGPAWVLCLINWLLAWQRFTWFWLFQPHTFLPIWAGFILTVNALAVKRSGSCLILRRPVHFVLLFPASAGFWWFFEYLNRFVQNWYYTGIEGMGPGEYSYFSSLAFATVLPGVLSMIDLLNTVPALGRGLARCRPVDLPTAGWIAPVTLATASLGLALIGIFPDQLFALLWVSPLLIVLSIQGLTGRRTLLYPLRSGDWRPVVVPALAALACGFFWETWNYFSLARWTYTIPFVQRFHLFEMPILGYGGYLPFGLECLLAGTPGDRRSVRWILAPRLRHRFDKTSVAFVETILKFGMFGLGVIAALGAAGIKTAALLGSLGVAGLTIGFALRDTLSNIICGWISPSPWRSPKTWTGRG
jgi:hypothetical protein